MFFSAGEGRKRQQQQRGGGKGVIIKFQEDQKNRTNCEGGKGENPTIIITLVTTKMTMVGRRRGDWCCVPRTFVSSWTTKKPYQCCLGGRGGGISRQGLQMEGLCATYKGKRGMLNIFIPSQTIPSPTSPQGGKIS